MAGPPAWSAYKTLRTLLFRLFKPVLGRQGSNLCMPEPKPGGLPLAYVPIANNPVFPVMENFFYTILMKKIQGWKQPVLQEIQGGNQTN